MSVAAAALSPLLRLASIAAAEVQLPRLFVHCSALLGLSGLLSRDMLVLRTLSLLSSLSALAFNLWNRLSSPAAWNVAFMSINLTQIIRLVFQNDNSITLSSEQQRLYEQVARARDTHDRQKSFPAQEGFSRRVERVTSV
eukprot:4511904-Pleurochrysis_carterae.AAC.3